MSKMSGFTEPSPDPPDMLVKEEIKEEPECDDILQHDVIMVQEEDEKPGLEHSSLKCKDETLLPLGIKEEPDFGEYGDLSTPSYVKSEMCGFMEPTQSLVKTETKEEDGGNLLQQEHLNGVQQVKETTGKGHDFNTETDTSTPTSAMTEEKCSPIGVEEEEGADSRGHGDEDDQCSSPTNAQTIQPKNMCTTPEQRKGKIYQCSVCLKTYASSRTLKYHKTMTRSCPKRLHVCPTCGKGFKKKGVLLRHQATHLKERPHECLECGKTFKLIYSLRTHQQIHAGAKPHQCSMCGKSFLRKSQVVIHERIHTAEKPYRCSECGKAFRRHYNLQLHQRIHTGEKPYECKTCGKCFISGTDLLRHTTSHNKEESHQCTVCGKFFKSLRCLKVHLKNHTEDKPYPCAVCGKCFVYKYHATRHERAHSNEKPYQCSECGHAFRQLSGLKIHQRIHRGEMMYHCSKCGEGFMTRHSMSKHLITHREPRPCSQCEKIFKRMADLIKHQRIHHAD